MRVSKKLLATILVLSICAFGYVVLADTNSVTVTFVIPSQVSHTISYGGACSASLFYFVENDTTKNGYQNATNVSSDTTGTGAFCQSDTVSGMTLNNVGSSTANITANFTSLPAGITVKVSNVSIGWNWTCNDDYRCNNDCVGSSGMENKGNCSTVNATKNQLLRGNMVAMTGTQKIWWWADMANFNSGVATTGVTATLTTTGRSVS
jgi:hypothetical protein